MREIKVGAWHVSQKRMYSAEELGKDQLTLSADSRGFVNVHGGDKTLSTFYGEHMIPLEYIGLKDKNGKEIYDGHIVRCRFFASSQGMQTYTVEWNEETTGWNPFADYDSDCMDYVVMDSVIIIGNIYENPELLEAK